MQPPPSSEGPPSPHPPPPPPSAERGVGVRWGEYLPEEEGPASTEDLLYTKHHCHHDPHMDTTA